MTQILEYVMQHYTLFLVGAILILLAIIGYYADKTNFGQGNNTEKNNNKESKNIENMRLSDVTGNINNDNINNELGELENKEIESTDEPTEVIEEGLNQQETQNLETFSDSILQNDLISENISDKDTLNTDINNNEVVGEDNLFESNLDVVDSNLPLVEEEKNNSLLNEEEFNKFNEEFNSILPEKEIINTDLLSDIEDLDLGKTQKLDLNDIPDLDDIELPKIKQLTSEEQDIWKF